MHSAFDDVRKDCVAGGITFPKDARGLFLLTRQGLQAMVDLQSSDAESVTGSSEKDDTLQQVKTTRAERDDALRHFEAVETYLSAKATELQEVQRAREECPEKHDVAI